MNILNVFKQSEIYFKDFINSLKQHMPYFIIASISFFVVLIFTNPVFFKMIFTELNTVEFMKQNSLLLNIISIVGQLTLIGAVFFYYYSFFKNRPIVTNVKVFVTTSIAANFFFILTAILPSIFICVLLNILGIEKQIFGIIFFVLFLIFSLYTLYVLPYFYGKALTESNGIIDVLKIFISALNPKKYFSFLKDKKYLEVVFNISFLLGIIMSICFIFISIIYVIMINETDKTLFQITFFLNYFLTSLMYVLISYAMIYISIKLYNKYTNQQGKVSYQEDNLLDTKKGDRNE